MKYPLLLLAIGCCLCATAQDVMTPELLWSLKHVSAEGLSKDGKYLFYASRQTDWKTEKSQTHYYTVNIANGQRDETGTPQYKTIVQRGNEAWYALEGNDLYKSTNHGDDWNLYYKGVQDANEVWVSPDGQYVAYSKDVLVQPVLGAQLYPDLPDATGKVYTNLDYRHWDKWRNGTYAHIFVASVKDGDAVDIMANELYDCPQKPFGGREDLVWAPDSKSLVYVCKKESGKESAQSTNTDLYHYNVDRRTTTDWTDGMMGYDIQPSFSPDGKRIAWVSMATDGYESDKSDIYIMDLDTKQKSKLNLTAKWDESVESFIWDRAGERIFFNAAWRGTVQMFSVDVPRSLDRREDHRVEEVTKGKFDVNDLIGQSGHDIIVSRCDMNHATELFAVNIHSGEMRKLTHENDDVYKNLKLSRTVMRMVTTTDGKKMGVWVIYPPDFDSTKKYPTLLYCQGGPQSALSQFYSIRWNFQLMAANGYIIVAPNRRGMPGWGVAWNQAISKDWGGQPMRDYLSAIDDVSKESYVDNDRRGCVGASYGGYSVYMLAGMHEGRFKTFIAHDGLFDLKSFYGTTEELWFPNWDIGGAYWKQPTPEAYAKFNPSNFVDKWDTPIMIVQGGIDYRVPVGQGLAAFQAAQLRGIKSKLLYMPNENHWVLHPQNGILWQREFFSWLAETLK